LIESKKGKGFGLKLAEDRFETPSLLPVGKLLGRIEPAPERILLVRCAPEPLVRFAQVELASAFPEAAITLLCQPGREMDGLECLVCPGQGFLRLEDMDIRSLRGLCCDLFVIPCSSVKRLQPSYHNINRIALASNAPGIVHLYSDRQASLCGPEFLVRLEKGFHAPFLEKKRQVITELAEYTGEHPEEVERKCDLAGLKAVALWREKQPADENAVCRFYQENDFYLYELMKTEYNGDEEDLVREVLSLCSPGDRVLEYGGGCGTLSIALAEKGCRVTHLDLGGPLLDFAAWRFRRRGFKVRIHPLDEKAADLCGPYDTLVSIYVLEHLFDPEGAMRAMRRALAPGGKMIIAVDFEESPVKNEPLPLHLCRMNRARYHELALELGLAHRESRGPLDIFES